MLSSWPEIRVLIQRGAFFVLNDSGGKDSQAMRITVCAALRHQGVQMERNCVVAHAALGRVEWPGALEHARDGAMRYGLPFLKCVAKRNFLQIVRERFASRPEVPCWPSASCRQCTSDLKRGPIRREVRRLAKFACRKLVVNCMGERAQESPSRAKKATLVLNKSMCTKSREWWDWMPIHSLTTQDVFSAIELAGEKPHWAYAAGNERLSCTFCILGSKNDLRNGAKQRPELYREYVQLERDTGYTMHQSRKPLTVLTGIEV